MAEIKEAGVVIVRGAVPKEVRHSTCTSNEIYVVVQEALGWKQSIKDYIAENRDRVISRSPIPVLKIITMAY
jgi:hypothetical protein